MARQPHPTDVTDEQWVLVHPLIPVYPGGRPRKTDTRDVLNAILYLLLTGCAWRFLPRDFPPRTTVWRFFDEWRHYGTLELIHDVLREKVREAEGREPTPSAGSIDSQSVDSPAGGEEQGRDNHKKVDGRKRHILVDTLGLLLAVPVTAASADDGRSAPRSLDRAGPGESPRLGLIRADNKYHNHALYDWVREDRDYRIRVVSRPPGSEGWVWLPRRWVVEIVHSQVTKPDVLPLRAGREDVVDLDLVVGHDDAITSNSTSSRLRSKVAS